MVAELKLFLQISKIPYDNMVGFLPEGELISQISF